MIRELIEKIVNIDHDIVDQVIREYKTDYGYWPEYTWSELEIKLPTVNVIARCGPNPPEHRLSGKTLVYHTGYLNTLTDTEIESLLND